jgi:hypothetical protein
MRFVSRLQYVLVQYIRRSTLRYKYSTVTRPSLPVHRTLARSGPYQPENLVYHRLRRFSSVRTLQAPEDEFASQHENGEGCGWGVMKWKMMCICLYLFVTHISVADSSPFLLVVRVRLHLAWHRRFQEAALRPQDEYSPRTRAVDLC